MTNKATQFKRGESGNKKGRPKGSKDKRTELRELLRPHATELVKKAVQLAKGGDTTALRLCLDRLIPPYRPRDAAIKMEKLTGTMTEQGQKIISAMGKGEITPSDAAAMLQALATQSKIMEIDELQKRVERLEERYNAK